MEKKNSQALHKIIFGQPKVRRSANSYLYQNNVLLSGLLGLLLILGVSACQDGPTTPKPPQLVVTSPVALLSEATEKSAALEHLETGAELVDLNQASRFLASIQLNGRLMQEPWLLVEVKSGKQGWVFAGAVRPKGLSAQQQTDWVLEKRFQALFGVQLAQRWQAWTSKDSLATDSAFSQSLRAGLQLRDTLNQILAGMVTRDPSQTAPNLFWLGDVTPYFIIQQLSTSEGYYFFLNYKAVAKRAAQTTGEADDQFAKIGFMAFPIDSIESAFPSWVFPLSMEESCSNLGSGKHFQIFQCIDQALQTSALFQLELLALKDWALEDILDKNRAYWQPQSAILSEMKQITDAKFACLNARDRLALGARKAMFEAPDENNLKLNLRTGE